MQSSQEGRDRSIESWIEGFSVRWRYETADIERINTEASRKNLARIVPVDKEYVEQLVGELNRGAVFPPLVGWEKGKELVLIDGNHRHEALLRADVPEANIYIVEQVDRALIRLMTIAANTRNGLQLSDQEKRMQAIRLAAEGVAQSEIARHLGMKSHAVSVTVRADTARHRAKGLVISGFGALREDLQAELGAAKLDSCMTRIGRFATRNPSIPVSDFRRVVQTANDARSEGAALETVDSALEELALKAQSKMTGQATKRRGQFDGRTLNGFINGIIKADVDKVAEQWKSGTDIEDKRSKIEKAREVLADLLSKLVSDAGEK